MKIFIYGACTLLPLLAAILMNTGCQSDYRTKSVIDTSYSDSVPWEKSKWWTAPVNILSANDPFIKESRLNPYTYNPADLFNHGKSGYKSSWPLQFTNWFQNAQRSASAPTNAPGANAVTTKIYEVYEPMYWKATLSSNVTGLSDNDRKYYRNALQDGIIQVMKESTENHLSALKAGDTRNNLILGDAALALTGGASVTGGALAKALAAASTGAQGARSLFNDQVFRNTLLESIIALIEKDQADFYENIRTNYQKQSIYDYTMEAAITDAKDYEVRGSFYNGLALLQKAVQNQINGIKNIVPINQLVATRITSPTEISINIPATKRISSTNSLTGVGLTQLNTGSILNYSNNVVTVTSIAVSSDSEARIIMTNNSTNAISGILPLPLLNGSGSLSIPITITVTNQ